MGGSAGYRTLGYRKSQAVKVAPGFSCMERTSARSTRAATTAAAFADRPCYALDCQATARRAFRRAAAARITLRALVAFHRASRPQSSNRRRGRDRSRFVNCCPRSPERTEDSAQLAFLSPTGFGVPRPSPSAPSSCAELRRSPGFRSSCFVLSPVSRRCSTPCSSQLSQSSCSRSAAEAHRAARQPERGLHPLLFRGSAVGTGRRCALYQALRLPTFVLYGGDPDANFELLPGAHARQRLRALVARRLASAGSPTWTHSRGYRSALHDTIGPSTSRNDSRIGSPSSKPCPSRDGSVWAA